MEEDNNDFETITLSNIWLKENVLDFMNRINHHELQAVNGTSEPNSLYGVDDKTITMMKYEGLRLMRSEISILSDNVKPYIKKSVYDVIKKMLEGILSDKYDGQIFRKQSYMKNGQIKYTQVLSEKYTRIFLPTIKKTKQMLFDEIADQEMLLPKKSNRGDDKISDVEDE